MKYFVIEGIDTSGKTTQFNLLKQKISYVDLYEYKDSKDIIMLNEPGGTEIGIAIRDILLNRTYDISNRSAFLLFLAQRAEIFERIKNLKNIIISDRSLISGIAYAHALDIKVAIELNLFATQNILPQKIVFLELSRDTLKQRLKDKKLDKIEELGIEYLLDTQQRFIDVFEYLNNMQYDNITKKPEILRLNANLSREELNEKICMFFGI